MKNGRSTPRRPIIPPFLVALLALTTLFAMAPQEAEANSGYGDFRVRNYATGYEINNHWWRGYAFTVSRETVVTHMYGGGGPNCVSGFQGGIFEAHWSGSPGVGMPTLGTMMGSVYPSGIPRPKMECFLIGIRLADCKG